MESGLSPLAELHTALAELELAGQSICARCRDRDHMDWRVAAKVGVADAALGGNRESPSARQALLRL